jgi:hypothetical protein
MKLFFAVLMSLLFSSHVFSKCAYFPEETETLYEGYTINYGMALESLMGKMGIEKTQSPEDAQFIVTVTADTYKKKRFYYALANLTISSAEGELAVFNQASDKICLGMLCSVNDIKRVIGKLFKKVDKKKLSAGNNCEL